MKSLIASALYILASIACFVVVRHGGTHRQAAPRPERRGWMVVCIALLLIGMVRPFEVHSIITAGLRRSAMASGWYAERAGQQMDLLLVLLFFLVIVSAFFLFETRRWHPSTRLGVAAAAYLFGLLVLNILSLHGLDRLLSRVVAGIPMRWLLDLAGLAAVVAAALWFGHAGRPSRC